MAYLPRNERRTEVLEAVVEIAADHGFEGATVRRISAAVGISAGNIHHLFGSAAELKKEAFRHFAEREIAQFDTAAEQPSPREQLHSYLASVAIGTDQRARRIWSSAGQEAVRDNEFAEVWAQEAQVWLNRVTDLLIKLVEVDVSQEAAIEAAWRLMSYSIGVNSLAASPSIGIGRDRINTHISTMIGYEVEALTSATRQFA